MQLNETRMKRQILILTLLCITTFVSGQTFAPTGAKWYYSAQASGAAPPNSEYYLYEAQLDTVVAGHFCKKISITYYEYSGAVTYPLPVFTYQSTDTVYYYNTIYSHFFPLYIFNVVQGDTLSFHTPIVPFPTTDTIWRAVVDSVTSLIISSDTLQRVWTTPLDNFSFNGSYIEKLGCDYLMLHQTLAQILEHDGPMRCYSDSSISYSFSSQPCDHRLISGVNEIGNPFLLSVFPNPTTNYINIETNISKQSHYKLYNSFGQLVKTGVLQTYLTTISIDNLNNGLYNIEITADSKTQRQCFIIER